MPESPSESPSEPLAPVLQLAGLALAHALWCVSEGQGLAPLIFAEKDGQRRLIQLGNERLADGVAAGQKLLLDDPEQFDRAVLVYDGTVTLEETPSDALVAELVAYRVARRGRVLLRYQDLKSEAFLVRPPNFVFSPPPHDALAATEAFHRGLQSHAQGRAVYEGVVRHEG